MTTTWQIFDTKRQLTDGLVVAIFYACTAQLGDCVDRVVGEIPVEGDSTSPDFRPFESLTQEILLEWAKTALGVEEVASIEQRLQDSVVSQKAAKDAETAVNGLPWMN